MDILTSREQEKAAYKLESMQDVIIQAVNLAEDFDKRHDIASGVGVDPNDILAITYNLLYSAARQYIQDKPDEDSTSMFRTFVALYDLVSSWHASLESPIDADDEEIPAKPDISDEDIKNLLNSERKEKLGKILNFVPNNE